ncbi:conserved hypothetical protein [Paracidovorax citrulli AAC00-1]|uniref:Uncharacterized protein n=1 Tax=Paracidovorax citrulli (strain AAC00-1) TaxID=397945 RepID=A1TL74_PARC0|nr:conserved hypothetical protein [Paracidovorax citrulli AAC00-1]
MPATFPCSPPRTTDEAFPPLFPRLAGRCTPLAAGRPDGGRRLPRRRLQVGAGTGRPARRDRRPRRRGIQRRQGSGAGHARLGAHLGRGQSARLPAGRRHAPLRPEPGTHLPGQASAPAVRHRYAAGGHRPQRTGHPPVLDARAAPRAGGDRGNRAHRARRGALPRARADGPRDLYRHLALAQVGPVPARHADRGPALTPPGSAVQEPR